MALLPKIPTMNLPSDLDTMIFRYDVEYAPCAHIDYKKFKEKVLSYIFLHKSIHPGGYILNVQDCLGLIVVLETDYG